MIRIWELGFAGVELGVVIMIFFGMGLGLGVWGWESGVGFLGGLGMDGWMDLSVWGWGEFLVFIKARACCVVL